jgi:hypothetical protein
VFILIININTTTVIGQEYVPLTWVTSRDEAISIALSEGKYVLLLAGASWCVHCYAMHYYICEENDPAYPIKSVILENYVPWFIDADDLELSAVWQAYAPGPPYYIPSTSRIDPRNPDNCIDQYYGDYGYYSDPYLAKETFYNRLLDGLGDLDSDGMPDKWERQNSLNALVDDASGDADEDGLTNINEYSAGTNPNDADSDDDGMPDGWEVQYGLDPLVDDAAGDPDGDGFNNLKEYQEETIPNDPKSKPVKGMPWLQLLLEEE